jgi:hypothetical protein
MITHADVALKTATETLFTAYTAMKLVARLGGPEEYDRAVEAYYRAVEAYDRAYEAYMAAYALSPNPGT